MHDNANEGVASKVIDESMMKPRSVWIPAFAGMTAACGRHFLRGSTAVVEGGVIPAKAGIQVNSSEG